MPVSSTTSIDVNSIVSQLMTVERQPLAGFAKQESQVQARLSALGTLKGALASLQGAAKALDSLDRFRVYTAKSSDETLFAASARAGAAAAGYSIEVRQLAASQTLRSGAYTSGSDAVGSGSLTFQFGSYDSGANSFTLNGEKAARTVVVAPGNNTLAGIRDAVNAAAIGVRANLINDGGATRLVFSSADTGLANSLKITVAGDSVGTDTDASGLSALAYDPTAAVGAGRNLVQASAAADALLRIDGVDVSASSNTVDDAIEGVTLQLLKAAQGTTSSLTVAQDVTGVRKSVEGFVKAYNDLATQIKNLTAYNAATKQGGLLQGDSIALSLTGRLRSQVAAAVAGAPAAMATLSQLGVATQADGSLKLDAARFEAAAAANFEDIAGLFTRLGRASQPAQVSYMGASSATRAGTFSVVATQAAQRGCLEAGGAAGLTITAGVNDALELTVDGVQTSVTLAAGTYASAAALAAELQTRLNGTTALVSAGAAVTVTQSAGVLCVTSNRYGGISSVGAAGGNAAAGLFGIAPVATLGQDVAGSINGAAAVGSGRMLTAGAGGDAEGLILSVSASAPGACGDVAFSIGLAPAFDKLANEFLATGGSLSARVDSLNARVKDIGRRQEAFNARLGDVEARYRAQYVALDALLTRMGTTSSFLTAQLANLPKA